MIGDDALFQVKDLIWTLAGALLGGVVGWFISLWFYRRGRRDMVDDAREADEARAESARLHVRRVALCLWREAQQPTPFGVDPARREMEAGRGALIRTGQADLVDSADDILDALAEWHDNGAPLTERVEMVANVRVLWVAAGGNPAELPDMVDP
ncbi:MAG: hypothetical protein JF887_13235 [Candidatus Dormibacteraeota bacterium]|uniref:Uncharacterized protein n=1 Tax=Candidatus Amunia macphersoniae TaxID=3127014 RepID=A0A934KJ39_9BACT|nr:hypothetical protein [Candidatus Dormibacteraeota bacterium]